MLLNAIICYLRFFRAATATVTVSPPRSAFSTSLVKNPNPKIIHRRPLLRRIPISKNIFPKQRILIGVVSREVSNLRPHPSPRAGAICPAGAPIPRHSIWLPAEFVDKHRGQQGPTRRRALARHGEDVNVMHNQESKERKLHTRYFLSGGATT